MGLLRLLLAAAVVIGHSRIFSAERSDSGSFYGLNWLNPHFAVQAFFIISGFYMALVLQEKYGKVRGGWKLFYLNRYLRLMPTYWLAAGTFVLLSFLTAQPWFFSWHVEGYSAPALGKLAYALFSDLTLLGQDTVPFLTIAGHEGYRYMILAPAWSVGTELLFYALAPLLVTRRTGELVQLAVLSLVVRFVISGCEIQGSYGQKFFPAELLFFLLGVLAYRLYQYYLRLEKVRVLNRPLCLATTFTLWAFVLLIGHLRPAMAGHSHNEDSLLTALVIFPLVPFAFHLTRSSAWDRFLGDLSYPVYLWHWVVVTYFTASCKYGKGSLLLLTTLAVSVPTVLWLEKPLDRWRQRLVSRRATDSQRAGRAGPQPTAA